MAKVSKQAKVAKVAKVAKGSKAKAANVASVKRSGKVASKAKGKAKVAKWQASEHVLQARADAAKASERMAKLGDKGKVSTIDLKAFKPGSLVHTRFSKVRVGMTMARIAELTGGPSGYDIACAMGKGRIAFK